MLQCLSIFQFTFSDSLNKNKEQIKKRLVVGYVPDQTRRRGNEEKLNVTVINIDSARERCPP